MDNRSKKYFITIFDNCALIHTSSRLSGVNLRFKSINSSLHNRKSTRLHSLRRMVINCKCTSNSCYLIFVCAKIVAWLAASHEQQLPPGEAEQRERDEKIEREREDGIWSKYARPFVQNAWRKCPYTSIRMSISNQVKRIRTRNSQHTKYS